MSPLTEEIARRGPDHVGSPTVARFKPEASDDTCRRVVQLAANQPSGTSQLVGNSFDRCVQLISTAVTLPTIVSQWDQPCDSDCDFAKPLAPCPAEAVTDDNGNRKLQPVFEC